MAVTGGYLPQLLGLDADEKGHLEPLPVAVDVIEAELAQPAELGLDVEQAVRGVFPIRSIAERLVEAPVQAVGRGGDVLEVGVDAAGLESLEDLGVQGALSFILEVVDGEAGDDRVERFRKPWVGGPAR